MKWSLVTNFGNPGDEWARMGVEAIIQEADPKHEFKYLRRDEGKDLESPIETDYIVVCSMPGIWSNMQGGRENSNRFHHSWQWYRRWLSEGRKILFAGVGSCMNLDVAIHDRDHYLAEVRLFMNRCSHYSRDSVASILIDGDTTLPCPSIFARHRQGVLPNPFRKLCNLMPSGAHEARLDKKENESWQSIKKDLSRQLMHVGFVFVAHDPAEVNHAKELGWPSGLVIQGDAKELLEIYATASVYVGNRVHGAIVARSFGAPALCIGYDTRIYAASRAGAFIINPSQVMGCGALTHATNGILEAPHEIDHKKEFGIQLQIFNNYMKGKR